MEHLQAAVKKAVESFEDKGKKTSIMRTERARTRRICKVNQAMNKARCREKENCTVDFALYPRLWCNEYSR